MNKIAVTKKWKTDHLQAYHFFLEGFTVDQIAEFADEELLYGDVSAKHLTQAQNLGGNARTIREFIRMRSSSGRVFNGEILVELIEAGFTGAKEVRAYAAHFNVKPREQDYFKRVIKAKKLYHVLPDPLI